jgi:hypothetical protein
MRGDGKEYTFDFIAELKINLRDLSQLGLFRHAIKTRAVKAVERNRSA